MKNFVYFFCAFMMSSNILFAVTKASVANGDWSTASTWSPSGVPASGDQIIIQHDITFNVAFTLAAGGSITIDVGASLVGTGTIDVTPNTSTATTITNNGTINITHIRQPTGGCVLYTLTNNGLIELTENNSSPTTSSSDIALFARGGTINNNSGAKILIPNGEIAVQNNSSGPECTILNNHGLIQAEAFLLHNYGVATNFADGVIIATLTGVSSPTVQIGGYYFYNYGTIQTCGNIIIHYKGGGNNANTYGGTALVLYSGSNIYAPNGNLNVNSGTFIDGTGGCIHIGGSVSNSGTMTGTFTMGTPASSNGTVAGTITWSNTDCGWAALGRSCDEAPASCPIPNCGTATIQKN